MDESTYLHPSLFCQAARHVLLPAPTAELKMERLLRPQWARRQAAEPAPASSAP
jgi:hypothetical protein